MNPPPAIQQTPSPMEQQPSEAPAAETGRYSKEFKEEVIRQYRCGRKGVEVAKQYGIPEGTLYRWNKEAKNAGGEIPEAKSTRPPTNASPINEEHRSLVLSLKKTHPNMGLAQIQNQLKRFHALKLSRQMIGRIFSEAGIPLQKQSSSESDSDPSKNRFEMSRPNELWAVDF